MKRLKVALITGVYPPRIGGPATQTHHLALVLKAQGHDPLVVTFGERFERVEIDGITVFRVPLYTGGPMAKIRQYTEALVFLIQILWKEKPDVFHVQTVGSLCLFVRLFCLIKPIPSLVKYAGDMVWETMMGKVDPDRLIPYETVFESSLKAKVLMKMEVFMLRGFTKIWATSRFQAGSLVRHLGISKDKIVIQPNYIIFQHGPKEMRRSTGRTVVLTASRFTPWKRVDRVIQAFCKVDVKDCELWIAGGEHPRIEAFLRKLVADLDLQKHVRFLGKISPLNMGEIYRRADIFVSATEYEPFGIVFVEAMSAGLPIVATSTGGIPEIVEDGRTGFLVAPGDVDEMAERLSQLIKNPILRERYSRAGVIQAKKFDLISHPHFLKRMYAAVLDAEKC